MDAQSKRKVQMIAMVGILVAALATTAALTLRPALAQGANSTQSNNNGQSTNTIPDLKGSVSIPQATNAFVRDNVKVPFATALKTVQDQANGGTVIGGQLGVAQGYLVYSFKVANYDAGTFRLVLVDAGNGTVLYTSADMTLHNGGLGLGCGGGHHGHGMNWGGKTSSTPSSPTPSSEDGNNSGGSSIPSSSM